MVTRRERFEIIIKTTKGEMVSEVATGKKQKWWEKKHNPAEIIPENIYRLREGTIDELYIKYKQQYGHIEWSDFTDYTRELLKQKIMI